MKRLKRCLKWAAMAAAAVVLLLLVVNVVLAWRAGARLEGRLAALRAAGEPVTLRDLQPEPVPAEQDAALLLSSIRPRLEAWQAESHQAFSDLRGQTPPESTPADRLTEEEYRTLRPLWDRYADIWPILQQAAARPTYRSQVDFTASAERFLMENDEQRALPYSGGNYLVQRIDLLRHEGQRDETLRTCVTLFALARHAEREPTLAAYHSPLLWRRSGAWLGNAILQEGPVAPGLRQALEEEVGRHDRLDGFLGALRSERALGLDMFQAMFTGEVGREAGGAARPSVLQTFAKWLAPLIQWRYRSHACDYLDVMNAAIAWGVRPYYQTIDQARPELKWSHDLTAHTVFEYSLVYGILERTRAEMRCLRVLNALQRRAETGDETTALTELGLPPDATIDPFSGELLRVKKSDRGWTVYSVGRDLKDHGGDIEDPVEPPDYGFGPPCDEPRSSESSSPESW